MSAPATPRRKKLSAFLSSPKSIDRSFKLRGYQPRGTFEKECHHFPNVPKAFLGLVKDDFHISSVIFSSYFFFNLSTDEFILQADDKVKGFFLTVHTDLVVLLIFTYCLLPKYIGISYV